MELVDGRLWGNSRRRSWAVYVRSYLVAARGEALRCNFERSWELLEKASKNTNGDQRLECRIAPLAAAIASITGRDGVDADRLIAVAAHNLGLRGDRVGDVVLEFVDWFHLAGKFDQAADLYDLARHSTEFDRFLSDLSRLPNGLASP